MLTMPVVGVLELASKYRYGLTSRGAPMYLFRPYDESLPEFIVGASIRDTTVNVIAVVDIPTPLPPSAEGTQAKPRGLLSRIIGPVGVRDAERIGLLTHYCAARQPPRVAVPEPDTADDALRVPIDAEHGWLVFHVDPPGCRDIDDAIAYHADSGQWAILIADAAAAVPADSDVDRTARAIGATFYDIDGEALRPMLPREISEGSASLLPGERRRAVAFIYGPSDSEEHWSLAWTTVAHSTTYDSFPESPVARQLGLTAVEPHAWIADQMIRYNAAAGALLAARGVGLLRVQSAADAAEVAGWQQIDPELAWMANEAAAYVPAGATSEKGHAGFGHETAGRETIGQVTTGHAGLNLVAYAHASSPLRRYADLHAQRCLKAIIRGGNGIPETTTTQTLADELNARQRANRRWSRDAHFLSVVEPGRVIPLDIIWVDATRVWVPEWRRLLRLRHDPPDPLPAPGTRGRIEVFCDPTQRNWMRRVLTAEPR